jgi:hypothetical protein
VSHTMSLSNVTESQISCALCRTMPTTTASAVGSVRFVLPTLRPSPAVPLQHRGGALRGLPAPALINATNLEDWMSRSALTLHGFTQLRDFVRPELFNCSSAASFKRHSQRKRIPFPWVAGKA